MLHTGDLSYSDIASFARESERLGYDGFFLTEESGKEAFSLLALLAGQTESIHLGTSIVNFYSRTPTLLAMAARSMHDLSAGRFGPFGLGAGGIGFMQRGHGIELDRPVGRARETIEIVRSLLSEPRTSYEGKWFHVDDFHLREGPLPAGTTIPLWLAALGPKMAAMSAKVADGMITNWLIPESLEEYRQLIKVECAKAGRDAGEVRIATLLMVCTDATDEDSRRAARRGVAFYCASQHYLHIADLAGLGERAREVKEVWETRDFDAAARLVSDEMLERFTVFGTEEQCRSKVRWLLDEGVYPIVYPLPRHHAMYDDHVAAARNVARWAGVS
jgi:alkanesulfonate monooxygenase SsuD/methylene tetrahydromethanopterin reductase-like flavin-dependent oxidoreductase (luciferase family)